MGQLNLNLTPEFERDLRTLMKARKIARKSDAIRLAVRLAAQGDSKRRDFEALIGALAGHQDRAPRFGSDEALWAKT